MKYKVEQREPPGMPAEQFTANKIGIITSITHGHNGPKVGEPVVKGYDGELLFLGSHTHTHRLCDFQIRHLKPGEVVEFTGE